MLKYIFILLFVVTTIWAQDAENRLANDKIKNQIIKETNKNELEELLTKLMNVVIKEKEKLLNILKDINYLKEVVISMVEVFYYRVLGKKEFIITGLII